MYIFIHVYPFSPLKGFPGNASGKEPTFQCKRHKTQGHKSCKFDPCFRKIPQRKAWQPTPVFLLGESHG